MSMQTVSLDRSPYLPSSSSADRLAASTRNASGRESAMATSKSVISTSSILREQTSETSISVLVWHPQVPSTSSGLALGKTPILGNVPQVKRKLTRKDRDSVGQSFYDLSSASAPPTSFSDAKTFGGLKNAAPSWLREKPSKTKLSGPSIPPQRSQGAWKKATMTIRESGVLLIYGEDRAMLHSISTTDLSASEIRLADDSLFNRPHVLGVFARPSTLTAGIRSPTLMGKTTSGQGKEKEEPLYLCFANSRKLYKWRALLRSFARPELYGPANALRRAATHRSYRQIDMTVHEIRFCTERIHVIDKGRRASGVTSPPPPDAAEDGRPGSSASHAPEKGSSSTHNGRNSIEHASRGITSVLERFSTRDSVDPDATRSSKNDEGQDDSKSSASTDEQGNLSGPITGPTIRHYEGLPFSSSSVGPEMERRGSDGSVQPIIQLQPSASSFCQVWMSGEVVARTKLVSGTSSLAFFDKLLLQDLPHIASLHIEVLQSNRPGKFASIGFVDVPVETMRRGELIEGWFPIWSPPRTEEIWSRYDEHIASYAREVVGELKVAMTIFDETILPSRKYTEIDATLNGPGCVDLMRKLCKELQEDKVVSHLVDVFTSGGTIVDRLADLTNAESATFAGEAALLFRGNTLLSRAIDKYQRRYCIDWLEACVGPTVRRVCADRIRLDSTEAPSILGSSLTSHGASNLANTANDDASVETLKSLSHELWNAIYSNRHKCPADLRSILANIRRTVNAHFDSSPGPGVQGVGAFVFLRLICPAITSPNLYGLMGSAPDSQSARTLMLLAKVFLALANKRPGFDKDKEPWLVKLNDFLKTQSTAYDDFITVVSTEAEESAKQEPLGDENDYAFQKLERDRIAGLTTLHRESIPPWGIKVDHTLAMASLVSFVARGASVELYEENPSEGPGSVSDHKDAQTNNEHSLDLFNNFIDLCCDVEDMAGYHLDRGGCQPEPLPIIASDGASGVYKTTSIFTANKAPPTPVPSGQSPSSIPSIYRGTSRQEVREAVHRSESYGSVRGRRATVSEGQWDPEDSPNEPSFSYVGEDSFLHRRSPASKRISDGESSRRAHQQQGPSTVDEEGDVFGSSGAQELSGSISRKSNGMMAAEDSTSLQDSPQNFSAGEGKTNDSSYDDSYSSAELAKKSNLPSVGAGAAARAAVDFSKQMNGEMGAVEESKKKRGWWRRNR